MANRSSASLLPGRQLSAVIVVVASVVLVTGMVWHMWSSGSLDPQKVFWGALANNLTADGVTITQSASVNGTETSQASQLDFGPNRRAQTVTTFNKAGAEVQTLELSTPSADYTKYTAITLGSAHLQGSVKPSDVVGIWANTTNTTSKDPGVPAIFPTVLLGLPAPMGRVTPQQASALMNEIQNEQVYTPAFNTVKRQRVGGRLQYVYTVTMQPILYVQLMKNFAHDMGMHELDSVNPNDYQTGTLTSMQWTIDARSRQFAAVTYDGEQKAFSGYGLHIQTPTPKDAIAGAALQSRVSALNAEIKN